MFDVTMQNHGSYVKRYSNFIPGCQCCGRQRHLSEGYRTVSVFDKTFG